MNLRVIKDEVENQILVNLVKRKHFIFVSSNRIFSISYTIRRNSLLKIPIEKLI